VDITFDTANLRTTDLRSDLDRRARFSMRRLAWLVPRARVLLTTIEGPGGTLYQRCHVVLHTFGSRRVAVTTLARDCRTAMDQAFRRAGRAVLRVWEAPLRRRRHAATPGTI